MNELDARDEKSELRRRILAVRDHLSDAERERLSAAVCARAAGLPELQEARTVMLFASFGSEIDTMPLLAWALAPASRLCLPRITGSRQMEAFRVSDPAADLQPGKYDIPEPREGSRGFRRSRSTSWSCRVRCSTTTAAAVGTAAASTTTTCRSLEGTPRGSPRPRAAAGAEDVCEPTTGGDAPSSPNGG